VQHAGLVLAAGRGRRFGDTPKQLADVRGMPLLQHAVWAQCAVPALERIVVVLGADADRIRAEVDFQDAEPVVCPGWEEGQAASLRCGLRELAGTRNVILTLGDQPLVTPQVIAGVMKHGAGWRAAYGGRPGHPVNLGPGLQRAALALEGDRGLRAVSHPWKLWECSHLCSDRDVDTPEDLEAIRSEARAVL
jgi:molybdenum cofactor cytidylyltransferase